MTDFEKRTLANGRAVLYRGDCRALMQAGIASAVEVTLTDPPYECPSFGRAMVRPRGTRTLDFDCDFEGVTTEVVLPALRQAAALTRHTLLSFCGLDQAPAIKGVLRQAAMNPKHAAWVKPYPPPPAPGNWWTSGFETIVYGFRPGAPFFDRHPGRCNVFIADSLRYGRAEKVGHQNQKPLALMEYLVTAVCAPEATVFDPFMGSGSTGVACLLTGRRFIGVEIDPAHFEVACQRIEKAWQRVQAGQLLDEGWDYQPGGTVADLIQRSVAAKTIFWPYELAKAYMVAVPGEIRDALAIAQRLQPQTGDAARRYAERVLADGPQAVEPYRTLGLLTQAEAAEVARLTGVGAVARELYDWTVDRYAPIHVRNEHGEQAVEEARGQRAVTVEDYAHLPAMILSYRRAPRAQRP